MICTYFGITHILMTGVISCICRACFQWNCVPAPHFESPWWVSSCSWKSVHIFNGTSPLALRLTACWFCSSTRILVFHCILWDGCPSRRDIQGPIDMSDSDCGRLCGSIGRGSLLLGPAEQCPQNREHRESQVCSRVVYQHISLYNSFKQFMSRYDMQ